MTVPPEDLYQPLAPISGGFHPLHGYADDGLFDYQEQAPSPVPAEPERPVPAPPAATTLERLLRRRRVSSRRAPGAARSS